jgi:Pyruvate/2-oxoacid:ferredoxin oxidoreductase delta subunit/ferredoxin
MSQLDPQPTPVTIEIDGEVHSVSEGITLIQAMWRIGRPMIHGVGCLGGVCGACPVMVRHKVGPGAEGYGAPNPNQMESKTSLACQTPVQAGMAVTFLPSDQSIKAIAPLPAAAPDRQTIFKFYPETKRCTACRSCTSVCPQGIDVMGGVRAAINGDLSAVAEKFTSCVMCGLCATVCEVRIRPHRVGMYARRLSGAFYPKAPLALLQRIEEIGSGKYEAEWDRMMSSPAPEELTASF